MSLRLGMLQVARLAPPRLGESRQLVGDFLRSSLNADGGFRNRAGASDLYYTVFGLEGLIALQETLPVAEVARYLSKFGDGDGLDLVHLACLARAWAALGTGARDVHRDALLARIERYRSDDGAFAQAAGAARGSVYASYLAFGAYQDLRVPLPRAEALAPAIAAARAQDGGYGNRPGDAHGLTPTTAGAVTLLKELGAPIDPHLGMWLLDRCHDSGGFYASPVAPLPDLLSTATALHALAALGVPSAAAALGAPLGTPIDGLQEACLDFIDSLWTNRGGFYGSWADDDLDCEYTYYGLLAIGHASLASPR